MCPICNDTGYQMQDIGTALMPDYIEVPCACNPAPTDADYYELWWHIGHVVDESRERVDDYLRTHPWHDDRPGYPTALELDPAVDPETYALYLTVAD